MILAALIIAAVLGSPAALDWLPPTPASLPERLALWLSADLFVAASVAVAVARAAHQRFFSDQDLTDDDRTSTRLAALRAQLQNTTEQAVIALPAHGAWLALAPQQIGLLSALAAMLFLAGRVLFFAGYSRGARGRALGFGLTFYPSLVLGVAAVPMAGAQLAASLAPPP